MTVFPKEAILVWNGMLARPRAVSESGAAQRPESSKPPRGCDRKQSFQRLTRRRRHEPNTPASRQI